MEKERKHYEYFEAISYLIPNNKQLREIDDVRKFLLEAKAITDALIDKGIVDPVDLANIAKDKYMQTDYLNMMKISFEGKIPSQYVERRFIENNQTFLCGWVDFQKRYFEKKFKLKLISPTED
jgi:hypothetical protein